MRSAHLPRVSAAMARTGRHLSPRGAETILYLCREGIDGGEMSARVWTEYRRAWRPVIREAIQRRHERRSR